MSEGKKQDGLTNFGVSEADATRETRFCIDHHSPGTHGVQFTVVLVEERGELFEWECDKLKWTVHCVLVFHLRKRLTKVEKQTTRSKKFVIRYLPSVI